MKRCKDCRTFSICKYNYDKTKNDVCESASDVGDYVRKRWLWFAWWIPKILIFTLALLLAGCSPGQHHGHIYIHDPNHIEIQFDRPMSMELERDGVKVKASSMQPGFFEDIIKFLLLRPR